MPTIRECSGVTANAGPLPTDHPRAFHVPPTQIRQSQGYKSSHNRAKNVRYQQEAGNSGGKGTIRLFWGWVRLGSLCSPGDGLLES